MAAAKAARAASGRGRCRSVACSGRVCFVAGTAVATPDGRGAHRNDPAGVRRGRKPPLRLEHLADDTITIVLEVTNPMWPDETAHVDLAPASAPLARREWVGRRRGVDRDGLHRHLGGGARHLHRPGPARNPALRGYDINEHPHAVSRLWSSSNLRGGSVPVRPPYSDNMDPLSSTCAPTDGIARSAARHDLHSARHIVGVAGSARAFGELRDTHDTGSESRRCTAGRWHGAETRRCYER